MHIIREGKSLDSQRERKESNPTGPIGQRPKLGKLDPKILAGFLKRFCPPDPRVVVGPKVGEDAAVIDMGDRFLVAATDPVTLASEGMGTYCVDVNANDVAVMGAEPRWFLATLLLPQAEGVEKMAEEIFSQVSEAGQRLGVALCGGHTEVTDGIERPILIGQMLGEVKKDRLVTSSEAQKGDLLLLTKGIAIEATAIIAKEREAELEGKYGEEFVRRCQNFLVDPGISIVKEAGLATRITRVHAMHDPTEGGIATALYELSWASKVGIRVQREALPILKETKILCQEFGLDPLGVIASGSLLVSLSPRDAPRVIEALEDEGIPCTVIGRVEGEGVRWEDGGDLPLFPQDELTKHFGISKKF